MQHHNYAVMSNSGKVIQEQDRHSLSVYLQSILSIDLTQWQGLIARAKVNCADKIETSLFLLVY